MKRNCYLLSRLFPILCNFSRLYNGYHIVWVEKEDTFLHTCKYAKITSLGSIETMQNQMQITQIGLHVFEYSHCAQNLTLNMYTKLVQVLHFDMSLTSWRWSCIENYRAFFVSCRRTPLQLATFECTCGLGQKSVQTDIYLFYVYGTNRRFSKTRPDARTLAKKEDVSGETRTYGNPSYTYEHLVLPSGIAVNFYSLLGYLLVLVTYC